jgi:hypothetical protein
METRALFAAAVSPNVDPDDDGEEFHRPASRSVAFSVRLRPEERALVAAAAARCNPPVAAGTWAKEALLEAARRFLDEQN